MLFGVELTDLIRAVGVLGLMAIVFAESGLLIGFFLPGDTLLFAAGFLASQDALGISVHLLVVLLFVAAVAGDSVGYWFGHRVGRRIFRRQDSLLFHQDNLRRAEDFYKKYGPITILLARFVPLVRTFAPIVAGVGKMHYQTFLLFNLIGGFLWAVGLTYLGYFAGAFFEAHGIDVDHFILPVVGFAMLVTIISPLIHLVRNRKSRQQLVKRLRSAFQKDANH
jgi:membrane-associated protein